MARKNTGRLGPFEGEQGIRRGVRCPRQVVLLSLTLLAWGWPCRGEAPSERNREGTEARTTSTWTSLGLGGGGAMFTPAVSPTDPNLILLGCDMSGAYRSTDGGQNWEMIHYRQLTGSTTVRPVWHPTESGLAYAADGWRGPLKVTRDKGRTWANLPGSPSGVTAIGIDPGHPDLMLAGGRRGLARSSDGGRTWENVGSVRGRLLGFHFDRTSSPARRVCFAATDQAVFRSDDGGATWRDAPAQPGPGSIVSFAGGSSEAASTCVLYCSVAGREQGEQGMGGIYRSDDRGATWMRAMGEGIDPPRGRNARYEFVLTTDVNPSRVYAAGGRDGQVFRSDSGGKSWRPILDTSRSSPTFNVGPSYLIDEQGSSRDNISGFGINPANPDHLVVADWMSCYITRDGGKTWAAAHTRSAEAPGRRGKGMRWVNNGLVVTSVWHFYIDPFEPDRHYIAYTDIGFSRSTDAGQTWYWQTGRPLRNTTYELAFDPETPGTIWGAFSDLHDIPNNNVISGRHYSPKAGGSVGVSTDFGATWKDSSHGLPGKPITSVVVDPKSPKGSRTLYASAFEDGVYRSTDGGRSWAKASEGLGQPRGSLRACRLILHRDGTLFCLVTALRKDGKFVAEGPGLYRSTDGGMSWHWINQSQPLLWPKDFDVDPHDSRVIYLGAADAGNAEGGLYKTTDSGATWKRVVRKGDDCFGATVDPRNPSRVFMCIAEGGSEPGLWRSDDAGETWTALEELPFPHAQRVSFDPSDPSIIYVSTFGGSVWRGPAR